MSFPEFVPRHPGMFYLGFLMLIIVTIILGLVCIGLIFYSLSIEIPKKIRNWKEKRSFGKK